MHWRRLALVVSLCSSRLFGQAAFAPHRVDWDLVNFVVIGDTSRGVELLATPNVRSNLAFADLTSMTIDPHVARGWAAGVARIVDSVGRLPRNDRSEFMTSPMAVVGGRQLMRVGLKRGAPRDRPFWLAVVDSVDQHKGWYVNASAADIRHLLTELDAVAEGSSLKPRKEKDEVSVSECEERPSIRTPGRLVYPPELARTGAEGRILAEYVIDTLGRAEPSSFEALINDGPQAVFTAALNAVMEQRFNPGKINGQPVRVRVQQWINFRMR